MPPKKPTSLSRRTLLTNLGAGAAAHALTPIFPALGTAGASEKRQALIAALEAAVADVLRTSEQASLMLLKFTDVVESFAKGVADKISSFYANENNSFKISRDISIQENAKKFRTIFINDCLNSTYMMDLNFAERLAADNSLSPLGKLGRGLFMKTQEWRLLSRPEHFLYKRFESYKAALEQLERKSHLDRTRLKSMNTGESLPPLFKAEEYYKPFLEWPYQPSQHKKPPKAPEWWSPLNEKMRLLIHAMGLYVQHYNIPHTGHIPDLNRLVINPAYSLPEHPRISVTQAIDIARDNMQPAAILQTPFSFFMAHFGNYSRKDAYLKISTIGLMASGLSLHKAKEDAEASLEIMETPPLFTIKRLQVSDKNFLTNRYFEVRLVDPPEKDEPAPMVAIYQYLWDSLKGRENGLEEISYKGDALRLNIALDSPAHKMLKEMLHDCFNWNQEWAAALPYGLETDHLLCSRRPIFGKTEEIKENLSLRL